MRYFLAILLSVFGCLSAEPCGFYQPDAGFISSIGSFAKPGVTSGTIQINLGYAAGHFIGIKHNFAEIGFFIAPEPIYTYQPLADFKLYRFSNGRWASSLGLGVRWWDGYSNIWGVNLFYDYLKGSIANFNRLGFGFELFTDLLDYRLNLYLPFESEKSRDRVVEDNPFREFETTFSGVDFAVGHAWYLGNNLDAEVAVGPYYYHHKDEKSIYGGQARLGLCWMRYFSLEGRFSDDNLFKANFQAMISINLPLLELLCSKESCFNKIIEPIQRTGIIFTKEKSHWITSSN